jgi:hypothetical protein
MLKQYATIAALSFTALAVAPQAHAHDIAGPYIAGALTGLVVGAAIVNPPAAYVAPPPVVYYPSPPAVYYAPPRVCTTHHPLRQSPITGRGIVTSMAGTSTTGVGTTS